MGAVYYYCFCELIIGLTSLGYKKRGCFWLMKFDHCELFFFFVFVFCFEV